MACGSCIVVTEDGETPPVTSERMKVSAFTDAGESIADLVAAELSVAPPASVMNSVQLQVSPSYAPPCQTSPYLVSPLDCSVFDSLTSCSQVVGTGRCALASRSLR